MGTGLDEDTLLIDLLKNVISVHNWDNEHYVISYLMDDGVVLPLDMLEYEESALVLDDVNLLSSDCSD